MGRIFNVDVLSQKSVDNLIKELRQYKDSLPKKCEEFVRRLYELGLPIIEQKIDEAGFTVDAKGIESGSSTEHNTHIELRHFGDYSQATIVVEGEDLFFIEFGSGVHYNGAVGSSPHPKGQELGYTIGSYGQGNGRKDTWGYYKDNGDLVLTHGTKATMPIQSAIDAIEQQMTEIAKEVFGA